MNINVDFAEAAGGKGFPRSLGTFLLNPCFHAVALSACPPCSTVAILSHWQRLFGV